MKTPRYVALEGDADQILDALTIDGAVLDEQLIFRQATPGLESRFADISPIGQTILDFIDGPEARKRLVEFCAAHQGRSITALPSRLDDEDTSLSNISVDNLTCGFVDVPLTRLRMVARISVLTALNDMPNGFLLRALPGSAISNRPEDNINRIDAQSRSSAHRILSQLSHAYWEDDLVSGEFLASEVWRTMRGVAVDAPVATFYADWNERIHPEDRPALSVYLRKLHQGQADFVPVIYRERHVDGHWMTILCKGAVVEWDANGAAVRIAGTDADITASHSAEEYTRQMAHLEQRWLIAAEYGQLGLWDNDEIAGTRYVSQTWRAMRGFGPDDTFDESYEALVERTHPDDRAALAEQIEAATNGKSDVVLLEYREKHCQGHWISILSRGRVISRDDQGRASRIIGIDTDITEIKASTEKIHRMSRRLELAIEATQVGIWDVDLSTRQMVWDARMMQIFGHDLLPGHIPIEKWEAALHPDDKQRVLSQTRDVVAGEIEFLDDYRIIRPDGTVRHIRARTTDVFDEDGRRSLIGVSWDVTADVEAADELRQAHALARERNDELERARAEMEYNALHDALTDLPNRRYLDEQLRKPFGPDHQFAVMHLDLDRFKQINDTLGHVTGDAVLRHVAGVMNGIVPKTATVARIGGDEFVVFFETAPRRELLVQIAELIVAELHVPFQANGQDCRIGASIGVALGRLRSKSSQEVFENADMALYEAKSSGRGRCVFFSEDMRIALKTKRVLADAVLGGLERDEFFCVYQPQFESGSLRLSGVEALVRWRRPDGTIELPSKFLGLAEELGVVNRIDQKVLSQVIADQENWKAMGLPVPRVSVNISARRIADPQLPQHLEELNIKPGQIAFELLETVFLDTPNPIITSNIAAIRSKGIEIEIDDFGTGHASIVGMLQLQPDRLKIDQQLIGPLVLGEKQGILVKSIIDIGRMHGIDIIAEGVETADHVRLLKQMGCHFLQGYGLGMPMPECDLRSRLKAGHWDFSAVA
ncbi:sensor domain-containing protein [Flavimaricola marinus]|uniref:sensor domain-containing protein n=1 Tax=Flavimaricola marinus TaxID=1819565 RepID=UPI001455A43F|nr:PAS domain-containing protein [Flavimaricola marinus]